ncbi:MAG: phosphopentomutase [Clostridia bacterium]|nr:phosphopentomutase [Clostridia bacterium]
MKKRVFLMVLDSLGIGGASDAEKFGDLGSNTLLSISKNQNFKAKNLIKLGLFNIDGVGGGIENPLSQYARLKEKSAGKDTTLGHWEMAGIISNAPMPTYPNGFPTEIILEFERLIGTKTLCNKPYSGTEVIKDYGKEHIKTGYPIVYTSADSVFQIATHDSVVPLEKLYEYSEIARKLLVGKHAVGRVIARPFTGEYPYIRTAYRKDFSLPPHKKTMLDKLKENGKTVLAVGKINDIFAGVGITSYVKTKSNSDGFSKVLDIQNQDFDGLCFINFVDFDSVFGHRNDVDGYAKAIAEFDEFLGDFLSGMKSSDTLIITADHGCDPSTPSTDHSREDVPFILYSIGVTPKNLGTISGFDHVSKTVLDILL